MRKFLFDDEIIPEFKPTRVGKRKGRKLVEFPHESQGGGEARKYIRRKLVEKETLKQIKEFRST